MNERSTLPHVRHVPLINIHGYKGNIYYVIKTDFIMKVFSKISNKDKSKP